MKSNFKLGSIISWLLLYFILVSLSFSQSYDIYAVDVNSGKIFQITRIPDAGEYNPNWSPNSMFIVHDVKGGPAPLGHSLYITNVRTARSRPLIGGQGGNDASWSPDGKSIAFDRDPPFGDPPDDATIYIVPAQGGLRTRIATDALDPDWAPNGQRLVFHRPTDGSIRTIGINGILETFVTYGARPVWSPDGKWIAYEYDGDIWKVRVTKSGIPIRRPQRITSDPAWEGSPSWSNDSKTIAFHSDRDGEFDIWTVPSSRGIPQKLIGMDEYGEYDPSFSKCGQYVAYGGFTATPDLKTNEENQPVTQIQSNFILLQNYPNPFNPITNIGFQIVESGFVSLKIYDSIGREVTTLVSEYLPAGSYKYQWDASGLASGIYRYQLVAGSFTQTRKMILLR